MLSETKNLLDDLTDFLPKGVIGNGGAGRGRRGGEMDGGGVSLCR